MIRTAKRTAEKYRMLRKGDSLLCGLSGGADSVALMLFLLMIKEEHDLTLYAVHVNHMIRGEEAKRDEKFCRDFCQKKGVPLFIERADIPRLCEEWGESAELAARKARYACFERLCREHSIKKVALAHNADDNAETILINMIRGSGISGLCGIPPLRDNIVRPLIEATREQIEEFLKEQKQDFVTDSTNRSDDYTRNKIRHGILPRIKEINPSVLQVLARQGESLRDDRDFLEGAAQELVKRARRRINGIEIDASDITEAHRAVALRALSRLCREQNGSTPSKKNVEDLLALCQKNETSKQISFTGLTAGVAYGRLSISPKEESLPPVSYCYTLTGDKGRIRIGQTPYTVCYQIIQNHGNPAEMEKKFIEFDQKIQKNLKYTLIDYDKIVDGVIIRTRKTKDNYVPLGFSGHRTVKKMMIDEKIPHKTRDILPVFESGGEILWVCGLRPNAAFAGDIHTENLLVLEVTEDR